MDGSMVWVVTTVFTDSLTDHQSVMDLLVWLV
jgi:hypothetical protein